MKHEYRKAEKEFYVPSTNPTILTIPPFNFLTIQGEGNPNSEDFSNKVGALYSLSYAIRMAPKGGFPIPNYFEYTVYPLEGLWDISEEAKRSKSPFSKDDLVYTIMIRQPSFVTNEVFKQALERTKKKKNYNPLIDEVLFNTIEEGLVVQSMHIGSFDEEKHTFASMTQYIESEGYERVSLLHREIYLSNIKVVAPEKLKTVLRFSIEKA
jgi:hypothetical protein